MLATPPLYVRVLPESSGGKAKVLAAVGVISIALIIIAAIGTSTCAIPMGVKASFFSLGLLGTCLFCQTLPICCLYVLASLENQTIFHGTRQAVGRENLVTSLQKELVRYRGNWVEAVYHLLRKSTRLPKESSGECHDHLQVGGTILTDEWPDELSSRRCLCKPYALKLRIEAGSDVKGSSDFTRIVQQLKDRYEQDISHPFFLILEHHFSEILNSPELALDGVEDMDKICRLALFDLLRNAIREGDTLILEGGYRLDFSGDTPLNALTSFGNQQEERLVYKEPLAVYESIRRATSPLGIRDRILAGYRRVFDDQQPTLNPDPDALELVCARVIRDRYYSSYMASRSAGGERQVITGEHALYMHKIRESFTIENSWWAPSGSCFLASALMVVMPDIPSRSADERRLILISYRNRVADFMQSRGFDHYKKFFESEVTFTNTVRDIREMARWFEDENQTMEAVAFVLDRPIHVFLPGLNSFTTDRTGTLLPSRVHNEGSGNPPIYILAGTHSQPLIPLLA